MVYKIFKEGEPSTTCCYFIEVKHIRTVKVIKYSEAFGKFPCYKKFELFNLDQVEGIEYPVSLAANNTHASYKLADQLIQNSGVVIEEGGYSCYFPEDDIIHMPLPDFFARIDYYYYSLLHELLHWTGHQSRLDRWQKVNLREADEYAFEELIAVIGNTFLMIDLGIKAKLIGYPTCIENWLKILQDDRKKLISAAWKADQALTYLQQFYTLESDSSFKTRTKKRTVNNFV